MRVRLVSTDKVREMIKPILIIAILAGIAALAAVACGGDDEEAAAPPAAATANDEAQDADEIRSGATGTDPETGAILYSLYVVGGGGTSSMLSNLHDRARFAWEVTDVTFNVGDTVTFTVIPLPPGASPGSSSTTHTFSIRELGSLTYVKFGKPATVTITFDKPGDFQYRCDLHIGEGMKGIITVQ